MAPSEVRAKLDENRQLRERPDFHPEPNAFIHIKIVTDRLCYQNINDPSLPLAGIFHDITKMECARPNPKTGWPTSPQHDIKGAQFSKQFSGWITEMGGDPEKVYWLCKEHMRFHDFLKMKKSKRDILGAHPWFHDLVLFAKADDMTSSWGSDDPLNKYKKL